MSRHDSTATENVKVLMLKGAKGEPGAPGASYDDTDIRNLIRSQNATIADLEELVTNFDVTILVQDMAAVESGPNGAATRAYSTGDLFIWGSQLYEATDNISIGDILEEDVNIQATTFANKLEDLETAIEDFTPDTSAIENALDELTKEQFNMYYGLENKTMDYTEDGNGLITGIVETSSDAVITTAFTTNGATTIITTTIVPTEGEYDYTRTFVIEEVSNGQTITESYIRTAKEG